MVEWNPFGDPADSVEGCGVSFDRVGPVVECDAPESTAFADPFADPADDIGALWSTGVSWNSLAQTRDMDCGVACVRMVATAVRGADPGRDACDEAVLLMPGQIAMTRTIAMGLGHLLQDCHAEISYISKLVEASQISSDELEAIEDLRQEASLFGVSIARRQVAMRDIIAFLNVGSTELSNRVIVALLNWNILTGLDGFSGHFCVVTSASANSVTLFDPDGGGNLCKSIPTIIFDSARKSQGTCEDLIFVSWKRSNEEHFKSVPAMLDDGSLQTLVEQGDHSQLVRAVDAQYLTILVVAAYKGNSTLARSVLEKGASTATTENEGICPLNVAAWRGHVAIVDLLLSFYADIHETDLEDGTPLRFASEAGHAGVVSSLLSQRSQVDVADNKGRTAMWMAARHGHVSVLSMLLNCDAELDRRCDGQATALFIAAKRGHICVVEGLLERKASINVADARGLTPLLVARSFGHLGVVELLIRKHAVDDYSSRQDNCLKTAHACNNETLLAPS